MNAIWQQHYVSFNWSLRISRASAMGAVILGLMLGLVPDNPTSAQVLNQRVVQLLGNNCSGLGAPGGSPSFGADLNAICQLPTTSSSGTAGSGGSASIQASAATILNRSILSRMEEVRAEEGHEDAGASSMRMNPFGALMPGLFRGASMASPSSPTDNSTGGTLNIGNATRWKGIGLFGAGFVESLNREVGVYQQGYDSTILGFTGGADYRFSRQLTAGLALTYYNQSGDIVKGGNFSTNSYGITLFSQYLPTVNSFVQFTGGYTYNNYNVVRNTFLTLPDPGGGGRPVNNVGGFPSSNSNGDVFRLGVLTGYDHPIGRFTLGPRIGLNYAYTHIDDYAEQGGQGLGLKFQDQTVHSLLSVLGIQGTAAFSTGVGVLVPQFNADYIHEFENSQRYITVQFTQDQRADPFLFKFQTDAPDRDYFNLGAGLVMVLPNGLQPFVNFRAMAGNSQFDNYAGSFGLRMEL